MVYPGKINVAKNHLKDLPKTGLSMEWTFLLSDTGFMNRLVFVALLKDFDNYLDRKGVQRPVILILDGFSGHTGLGKFKHNFHASLFSNTNILFFSRDWGILYCQGDTAVATQTPVYPCDTAA